MCVDCVFSAYLAAWGNIPQLGVNYICILFPAEVTLQCFYIVKEWNQMLKSHDGTVSVGLSHSFVNLCVLEKNFSHPRGLPQYPAQVRGLS